MSDSDISESIYNILNKLFSKLFSSIDNGIYTALDDLIFIDEKILEKNNFSKILGTSNTNGILLICNALIFGIVLFYATNYLISNFTLGKIQTPSQFFFKCIIYVVLMNCSIMVCTEIIKLISIISEFIKEIGEDLFKEKVSFANFLNLINEEVYLEESGLDIFSFKGIAKSFTSAGFLNLIFTYSLRYILIQVFVLLSPFAILSLILEKTEWFFKTWLKIFIALLIEQVFISIILVLGFSIGDTNNSCFNQLLYIGVIYALIRCNSYVMQIFGGLSTSISGNLGNLVKTR